MRSVRIAVVTGFAVAGSVVAGCSEAPPPSVPSTPVAAAARPDAVTACTAQLVYWAGEQLRGADDGGDYQHHGLTSEQNDALAAIVADAQARGPALPPDQVPRAARAACARLVAANPTPSGF